MIESILVFASLPVGMVSKFSPSLFARLNFLQPNLASMKWQHSKNWCYAVKMFARLVIIVIAPSCLFYFSVHYSQSRNIPTNRLSNPYAYRRPCPQPGACSVFRWQNGGSVRSGFQLEAKIWQ